MQQRNKKKGAPVENRKRRKSEYTLKENETVSGNGKEQRRGKKEKYRIRVRANRRGRH